MNQQSLTPAGENVVPDEVPIIHDIESAPHTELPAPKPDEPTATLDVEAPDVEQIDLAYEVLDYLTTPGT